MIKLKFFLSLLMLRVLLDYSYVNFIFKYFEYMNFNYDLDIKQYVLSFILYLMVLPTCSVYLKKVSNYFFLIAVIFFIAPITSIFGLDSSRSIVIVFLSISSVFIMYLIINSRSISFKKLPFIINGELIVVLFCFFSVFLVLANFVQSGARINFDLELVYNFRDGNSKLSEYGIFTYLNNWTYSIFTLYLIAWSLKKSKFIILSLILFFQVIFFAYSAHKAVLFMPVMVIGVWYYFRNGNNLLLIPYSISISLIFCVMIFNFTDDILISSLYVRRLFFVPAQLSFSYYEFFINNEFIYWSQSFLKYFIEYPYKKDLSSMIGNWLFNDDTRANNGIVSSGYANLGLFGVIFYSVILGFIIKAIDDFSQSGNMPTWYAVSLVASPLNVALIQSDLFTALLTHGLLISLLLIYISRKKNGDL